MALVAALGAAAGLRAEDVLFAVDRSNPAAEMVRMVDPYTGDSEVVWRGGGDLDIAVSRDLTRLYVNHLNGAGRGHKLTAVDLATGARLATVDTPHRLRWTVPTAPVMKLSPDGRKLYLLNLHSSPEEERHAVVVFDTDFSRFVGEEVSLGECSGAQLWPLDGDGEVLVLCRGSGMVHSLKFASDGAMEKHERVQIPPAPVMPAPDPRVGRTDGGEAIAQAALAQDGRTLYLAKNKGSFLKLDVAGLALSEIPVKGLREGSMLRKFGSAMIEPSAWHLSFEVPSGYDIWFVLQGVLNLESSTVMFPENRGKARAGVGIDPGGRYVYITNPNGEGIHVLDAATAEAVTVIEAVRKPAFVIRRTRG